MVYAAGNLFSAWRRLGGLVSTDRAVELVVDRQRQLFSSASDPVAA
jgi:hypothetical protein